jgi:uncharacterized membrane protein YfcA
MMLTLIGLFSGIISGMGIGGGAVLVPALSLLTDLSQQQCQSINLLVFIPASVAALIVHQKRGNIARQKTAPLILFGIIGAVIGSFGALYLDPDILRRVFAVFLFFAGLAELLIKPKRMGKPVKAAKHKLR